MINPFLKWAGGKRQLLPELLSRVPKRYGAYYEPFLGGGALFFALRSGTKPPRHAFLGDRNKRLIAAYRGVRDDVGKVIRMLCEMPYDPEYFKIARDRFNEKDQLDHIVAALMIYLNHTCFNGLYRENLKGQYNVPFGRYANPTICDTGALYAASRALVSARLSASSFQTHGRPPERGDFVYFDPPYVPLDGTSNFTEYNASGFGPQQQIALRNYARTLIGRGVHVLLSNSSAARPLYEMPPFAIVEVSAKRAINSKAGRKPIIELLIEGRP